jgi:NAD(P)-dependent dehydrogenase (short-subunit alcohol dehydrogenase family)
MDRKLLIFGANGALGKGITKTFLSKNFDEIYLFGSNFDENFSDSRIKPIIAKDLTIEKNVIVALNNVRVNEKTNLFLVSTIGGYYGGITVWESEETDFDRMFNLNLKSNYFLCKNFVDLVKRSSGGSICLVSAYTANHPEKLKFIYGASKSALNYMVKVLAEEGESINVSVNAIAPFIIDTSANREWNKSGNTEKWIKPEEIGELINSLFDNYNFISGNIIELKYRFGK